MCTQTTDRSAARKVMRQVARPAAELDAKVRKIDDSRRSDILVSLPSILTALIPMVLVGAVAVGAQSVLVAVVVIKIIRRW